MTDNNQNKPKDQPTPDSSNEPQNPDASSLPPPPPITPPPTDQESNDILSPWWSAEVPTGQPTKPGGDKVMLTFNRKAIREELGPDGNKTGSQSDEWTEFCVFLAPNEFFKRSKGKGKIEDSINKNGKKLNQSCSMLCFLKESEERRKAKLEELKIPNSWNPFYGRWVIASTRLDMSMEHLAGKNIEYVCFYLTSDGWVEKLPVKKAVPGYRSIELGEYAELLGQRAKKMVFGSFTPLQNFTKRYMDSWKDGTQKAFFLRFWESSQRGDAFMLVKDNTKKMIDSALCNIKKSSDEENNNKKDPNK
ncbi:hypothetical protein CLU79DRAFT_730441 [Phycomyces nitens]|nr:hypothetical protein CLU79DRAFT_730441 [Phycomyces nitens]